MKFLPILLLLAQTPEPDLERDYLATLDGSYQHMVAIVVTHTDGRPYRGTVQCSGYWYKYADEDETQSGWALPFLADSRGAIVMNPHKEDGGFTCWATDYPDQKVLVDLDSGQQVFRLTVSR